MSMSDPIADFLTRVRNAVRAGHAEVEIPWSSFKERLATLLVDEGYINQAVAEGEAHAVERDRVPQPAVFVLRPCQLVPHAVRTTRSTRRSC